MGNQTKSNSKLGHMNGANVKKRVSIGRHKRQCGICAHPQKEQIEADFVSWRSAVVIAEEHQLGDKVSIYRHAHAFGLFAKRQRNVRAALEHIIKQAGDVVVTYSTVSGCNLRYSQLNDEGP